MPRLRTHLQWLFQALDICALTIAIVSTFGSASFACTGTACMQIWSTADGGGALTVYWDYTKVVQTFFRLCAGGSCFFSNNDPGFMAPPTEAAPAPGLYRLVDGTDVTIEIIAIDDGLSMQVNDKNIIQAPDMKLLGTMPSIHVHPIWKINVPQDHFDNYRVSYKLTTTSPAYSESEVYVQTVTNIQPPPDVTPTPTATPIPTISGCPGDCDTSTTVTVDELVKCVTIALGNAGLDTCPVCDLDNSTTVTVDELVAAVNAALSGCPTQVPATLEEIQSTIFTPSCATQFCHDATSHTENLVLEAGASYDSLVNMPSVESSLLRVKSGDPSNSFLMRKLTGQLQGEGSQMPQTGGPLSPDKIQLVRDWILQGAQR